MSARRQSRRYRETVCATEKARRVVNRAKNKDSGAGIKRWRRQERPPLLHAAVAAIDCIPWSPGLLELLLDEMYVADSVEELLGSGLRDLPKRQYARAVAVALILRHSWRADDLDFILGRLGVKGSRGRKDEGDDCR